MFNLTVTWVPEDDENSEERGASIASVLTRFPTGAVRVSSPGYARLTFQFKSENEAWRLGALLEGDGMIVSYEVSKCPE